MIEATYIVFIIVACVLGAAVGFAGHFVRAHATFPPEDLGLREPWNSISREDYQWEKHVVGAKWDDNGYWDSESNRNLVYYVLSGIAAPLLFGFVYWSQRAEIVSFACTSLQGFGLSPPICP